MFTLALLIGIYAYSIFLIGIIGQLKTSLIFLITIIFFTGGAVYSIKNVKGLKFKLENSKIGLLEISCILAISLSALVNLIGAVGPEIFYDALWYHLTLPKLYLAKNVIYYIPGDLLYYSQMPRLGEILFTAALALTNEIGAKFIHYFFGLLTTVTIIICGKKFFNLKVALIAALIFYSNLIVAWQSTTAYIDLIRTFFEASAFFVFLNWWKKKNDADLVKSGILTGLALSTKYHVFGSIAIFSILIIIFSHNQKLLKITKFVAPAIFVASPWFVSAYLSTGNPVYPLFSGILNDTHNFVLRNFMDFFFDFTKLSNRPSDWASPISPIYLILMPLIFFALKEIKVVKIISLYCLLAYLVWFLTPRTGGTRFILPYLPIFSLLVSSIFFVKSKNLNSLKTIALVGIFSVVIFNLLIRTYVNFKNIPVILGKTSKHQFLVENLDFTNAFYDTDNYFSKNISKNDLVYIIGGQNLFYVNFPFTHESFGENVKYNYIMTQYEDLPRKFGELKPIYQNEKTFVKLYKLPMAKSSRYSL